MSTPCPHCHTTVRHGERYGCCSGCGILFVGLTAFEAHQRPVGNCLDVTNHRRKDGTLAFEAVRKGDAVAWRLAARPGAPANPWAKETMP